MKRLLLGMLLLQPVAAEDVTFHVYPPGAKVWLRGGVAGNERYLGPAGKPIPVPSEAYNASNYEVVIRHPDGHHQEKIERPVYRSARWPPQGQIELAPSNGIQQLLDLVRYPTQRSLTFLLLLLAGCGALLGRAWWLRRRLAAQQAESARARLQALDEKKRQEAERARAEAERKQAEAEKRKAQAQQGALQLREEAIRKNQSKDRWIGAKLGPYTPLEFLGRGASGRVYLGMLLEPDPSLPEKVAVKVVETDGGMAEELKKRFRSEAELGKSFAHPHVVKYYGAGEQADAIYLFLELVEGARTLKDAVKPGGLPKAEVCKLLRPVAEALDYMHERGCFHRDLKPENVMLTRSGMPKIADLGLAKNPMVTQLTRTGEGFGTLAYVAPEQLMDFRTADGFADQYSFGCMTYELLSGELPFPAPDPNVLIMLHLQQMPAPIASLSEEANAVLMQMLAKDKSARFKTLKEAIDALARAAD